MATQPSYFAIKSARGVEPYTNVSLRLNGALQYSYRVARDWVAPLRSLPLSIAQFREPSLLSLSHPGRFTLLGFFL